MTYPLVVYNGKGSASFMQFSFSDTSHEDRAEVGTEGGIEENKPGDGSTIADEMDFENLRSSL